MHDGGNKKAAIQTSGPKKGGRSLSHNPVSLIILNNPSHYNLQFAGIAFQKDDKNKYLLVIFPEGDDTLIRRQYKSIKGAKIAFARRYNPGLRQKKRAPDWSRDILRYTYHNDDKKEVAKKTNE
ncbi:MAG: hypothetical protein KAT34_03795 [Candidatus Aminicenantes bacterium]|nr:hypothetical protein [Candidatus Aminicenantes bacterium]